MQNRRVLVAAAVAASALVVATGADSARLQEPYGSGVQASVPLAGIITTLAGTPDVSGHTGDGGPATAARLYFPRSTAVDSHGVMYIADTLNNLVRRVDAAGVITTFAGGGPGLHPPGPARQASMQATRAIAVDSHDNVYVAEGGFVWRITPDGTLYSFAGGGAALGDGGPAQNAELGDPRGLAVDAHDNVYIADFSQNTALGNRVRKVDANTGRISTVAGTGDYGSTGDGGPATSATLKGPDSVAVDAQGQLYIGEWYGCVVRKVATNGTISTIAGNGVCGSGFPEGPATQVPLYDVPAVAVDTDGDVFLSDGDRLIMEIVDGVLTLVGGNRSGGRYVEGGPATAGYLSAGGMTFDAGGALLIADFASNTVRKITPGLAPPAPPPPPPPPPPTPPPPPATPTPPAPPPVTPAPPRSTPTHAPTPNPAPGPRDTTVEPAPGGKGFRIQVLFTVPKSCGPPCTARAELRTRNGARRFRVVLLGPSLRGDGKVVLGTRNAIPLAKSAGRRVRFYLTVSKAALLRTPFNTQGSYRLAETRLRVLIHSTRGDSLFVRDGHIKVSIPRIRSGALPGLKGIL